MCDDSRDDRDVDVDVDVQRRCVWGEVQGLIGPVWS